MRRRGSRRRRTTASRGVRRPRAPSRSSPRIGTAAPTSAARPRRTNCARGEPPGEASEAMQEHGAEDQPGDEVLLEARAASAASSPATSARRAEVRCAASRVSQKLPMISGRARISPLTASASIIGLMCSAATATAVHRAARSLATSAGPPGPRSARAGRRPARRGAAGSADRRSRRTPSRRRSAAAAGPRSTHRTCCRAADARPGPPAGSPPRPSATACRSPGSRRTSAAAAAIQGVGRESTREKMPFANRCRRAGIAIQPRPLRTRYHLASPTVMRQAWQPEPSVAIIRRALDDLSRRCVPETSATRDRNVARSCWPQRLEEALCCGEFARRCPTARAPWRCLPSAAATLGVNILGLQIFPGIGAVTDELVLQTPPDVGSRTDRAAARARPAGWRSARRAAPRPRWPTSPPATCRRRARSWPTRPPSPRWWPCSSTPRPSPPPPGDGAGPADVMEMTWPTSRSRCGVRRRSPPPSTPGVRRWPSWSATCSPRTDADARAPPRSRTGRRGAGVRRRRRPRPCRGRWTAVGEAVRRRRLPTARTTCDSVTAARRPGLAAARYRHPAAGRRRPARPGPGRARRSC